MDKISTIVLGVGLIVIMLGMGLSLTVNDFKRILIYPKAVVIGLINQLILLPIIGFLLASNFNLQPEIAVGIMILAACPGGTTSNLICHLAKGNTALSVTLTAISSFITILSIPFIVNFSLEHFLNKSEIIKLDTLKTVIQVLVVTVIPVVIGMFIRSKNTNFALKMEKPVRTASGILMIVIVLGVCIKERNNFINGFQQAGLVALSLNVITMVFGYITAKLFKIEKRSAISIAIESGVQNGTLAISIAILLLNNNVFAIAPAVYSFLMFFTGGIMIFFGTRKP